jgi:hypothetical protein
MRCTGAQGTESESGQSTVEFLGVLPATLLVILAAWQLVLAGQSAWLAARAAHAAARADAVGADVERAARSALPVRLRSGVHVERASGGGVVVRLGRVTAHARQEGR